MVRFGTGQLGTMLFAAMAGLIVVALTLGLTISLLEASGSLTSALIPAAEPGDLHTLFRSARVERHTGQDIRPRSQLRHFYHAEVGAEALPLHAETALGIKHWLGSSSFFANDDY